MNHSGFKPEPPIVGMIMCYHCIRHPLVNLYYIGHFWQYLFLNSHFLFLLCQKQHGSGFSLLQIVLHHNKNYCIQNYKCSWQQ